MKLEPSFFDDVKAYTLDLYKNEKIEKPAILTIDYFTREIDHFLAYVPEVSTPVRGGFELDTIVHNQSYFEGKVCFSMHNHPGIKKEDLCFSLSDYYANIFMKSFFYLARANYYGSIVVGVDEVIYKAIDFQKAFILDPEMPNDFIFSTFPSTKSISNSQIVDKEILINNHYKASSECFTLKDIHAMVSNPMRKTFFYMDIDANKERVFHIQNAYNQIIVLDIKKYPY